MQNAKEQKKEYQKPEMKEILLKTEGSLLQSSDPFRAATRLAAIRPDGTARAHSFGNAR